jgi:hypothetical protein
MLFRLAEASAYESVNEKIGVTAVLNITAANRRDGCFRSSSYDKSTKFLKQSKFFNSPSSKDAMEVAASITKTMSAVGSHTTES